MRYELLKDSKEPTLKVWLRTDMAGTDVALMVTEESGNDWVIATLCKNGTLLIASNIPDSTGLAVDTKGYIKTVKEGT